MKELLDKLSSYNLFNNFFPGVVFVIILGKFTQYDLIQKDLVTGVFFYYFIGLVIGRVGSVLIEPIFRFFIKYADYKDFISASKNDAKIDLLSEVNNMYRTIVATFFLLSVAKAYELLSISYPSLSNTTSYILIIFIIILFVASYVKQTKYVIQRVEKSK